MLPIPLGVLYPSLFAISAAPEILVQEAFLEGHWNILFRRHLSAAEDANRLMLLRSLPGALSEAPVSAAWQLHPSGEFTVNSAYRALFQGPELGWTAPLWKAPLPLSIRIFVWQLLRDRLPSGAEVAKRNGPCDGLCPLCGTLETCAHIMFSCSAAQALWCFVREALGPAWGAQELGEFLQSQAYRAGGGRRLFWLVFAAISWSLWNVRNKMVIEKVYPSRVSDPVFSFLAFLQQWSPLVRQRDRATFDSSMRALRTAAIPLSAPTSPAQAS
uniref:Uncharacterized protein n=1 Tax=Avena sativa TaxID=4498 RepID=A0ACD5ZW81_AVESA